MKSAFGFIVYEIIDYVPRRWHTQRVSVAIIASSSRFPLKLQTGVYSFLLYDMVVIAATATISTVGTIGTDTLVYKLVGKVEREQT